MTLAYTLDKPAGYAPGDTITLTITSDKRLQAQPAVPITSAGESVSLLLTLLYPVLLADATRKWTLKSDDGKTAVYQSTM